MLFGCCGVTADRILSIVAIILSGAAIGWNIYRDVLLKPRVRVSARVMFGITKIADQPIRVFLLSVVNFGPGVVLLKSATVRERSLLRDLLRGARQWIVVVPFEQLPRKLQPGESVDFTFNYDEKLFLRERFTQIGIFDTFARTPLGTKGRREARTRAFCKGLSLSPP